MHFQGIFTTSQISILPRDQPLKFDFPEPDTFSAVIDQSKEPVEGYIHFVEEVAPRIETLLARWKVDSRWPNSDEDKKSLATFFEDKYSLASERVTQLIHLLRWRCGDAGPQRAYRTLGVSWSFDGSSWERFPPQRPQAFYVTFARVQDPAEIMGEIARAIAARSRRPLSFELLEEAWGLLATSPRSAVIMGVGALEFAVKDFIAHHVPQAEWLAFELPAPPITRILEEYLPRLGTRSPRLPRTVRSTIYKMIKSRNEIAHRGEKSPPHEAILKFLIAVRDSLWLLEWCSGFDRAWEFLTSEAGSEYLAEHWEKAIDLAEGLSPRDKNQIKPLLPAVFSSKGKETEKAGDLLIRLKDKLPGPFLNYLGSSAVESVKEKLGFSQKGKEMAPADDRGPDGNTSAV